MCVYTDISQMKNRYSCLKNMISKNVTVHTYYSYLYVTIYM